jgi:hypothetical protein
MDEEIKERLAARDRLMRQQSLRLTPEQRLEKLWQLQEASWERLRNSPEAYAHFIRRNFKAPRYPASANRSGFGQLINTHLKAHAKTALLRHNHDLKNLSLER